MKMMSAIENLESNLHTLRTGRASSAMLDRIEVDYYGAPTPINQMARINVVEGTQLVIKPYDRSLVKAIVHAVQASNLGLNPQGEGDLVRIQVPTLTEDRRKELAKERRLQSVMFVVMPMMPLKKIKNFVKMKKKQSWKNHKN